MPTTLAVLLLYASLAFAQQGNVAPNPCTTVEQKQFDFWVGDWNLTWPTQDGAFGHGTNNIHRILDGCVVQENFSGEESMPLRGTSVSIFDARSGKWKQTWVDNEGGYLDFTGEFRMQQMILSRSFAKPDGTTVQQRMVWKNITSDQFDWSWESSTDGGKTWKVLWPIHYKRKA